MNNPIPYDDVMLPSALERQQIFYWLQKVSSVTAWRRIFEYYKAWAEATEESLREADERGWADKTSLPESDYVLILKCLAHCEEGVTRLGKGDKRVFKFDANGEFVMGFRMLSHWWTMKTRIDAGENGIDEEHTPHWDKFTATLTDAIFAWGECSVAILEPHYLGESAPVPYGKWIKQEFKTYHFPSELELVADPILNTFVRTDEYTPCSGIWEPIEASPKKNLLRSLFTAVAPPQPPFKIMGAMNYLHGGSKAPQITIETATDNIDLDTTWRLLWRDDRYSDGVIPEIESSYRFTQPAKAPNKFPSVTSKDEMIWAESGALAPVSGTWLLEFDINVHAKLKKGDKLPLHQDRVVRWVLALK